jgi:hypothetical protein
MNELDSRPSLGRFGVTARLFHLVDEMPRDKQLILLKQLLGERITSHLCKLVIGMTDEQIQRLCEQLEDLPFEDAQVTTINLDDDAASMRQISRTSCQLKAICVAEGHTFESVITDISTVGMFIKPPPAACPAGTLIRVSCRLPGRPKALVLNGEVLRNEEAGIAVRLTGVSAEQDSAIRYFILNRSQNQI